MKNFFKTAAVSLAVLALALTLAACGGDKNKNDAPGTGGVSQTEGFPKLPFGGSEYELPPMPIE